LSNFGAFADVAPFGGPFYISGGAYVGKKEADLLATPATDVTIGGTTFTPAEVGSLLGKPSSKMWRLMPALRSIILRTVSVAGHLMPVRALCLLDLPTSNLTSANGLLSSDPTLLNEIREEVLAIEQDAEDYKYFPVLTVGVTRKF